MILNDIHGRIKNYYINPISRICAACRLNSIPFQYHMELTPKEEIEWLGQFKNYMRPADFYRDNRIMYPNDEDCVFDAIWCFGSWGKEKGYVETYHELGVDEFGDPDIMTAEAAFKIIFEHWKSNSRVLLEED